MRLITSVLCIVFVLYSVQTAEAQFRSSNNESTIEVNSVDIAPTNTPAYPRTRNISPTRSPENEQESLPLPPVKTTIPQFFTITLDHADIDFGTIDPTEPVIRTNAITLNRGNAKGMSLFVYQNHTLQASNQAFIPDTTCDDGACSAKAASIWQNTLTYGSGYHCDSIAMCTGDFANQQSYRPFATVSRSQIAESILNATSTSDTVNVKLNFKINVSGTQQKGAYTNAVMFIAAPTF